MLGIGWSMLQPVCMTIILCVVFKNLFGQKDILNYGAFVLAGLSFWNYVMAISVHSCQSFVHSEAYIRQCPTPLSIYPLRMMLGGAFHFIIALALVLVMSWMFHGFANLEALPALLPCLLLLLVFGWSLATLMGFANVFFYDTQHIAEVFFQVLFYLTPIFYPPRVLMENHMGWVLQYNPFAVFLSLIRQPMLDGQVPDAAAYLMPLITTVVTFVLACLTVSRLKDRLIFRL
jgi:ABC-type polysaccharide/polyol phosphate export permease